MKTSFLNIEPKPAQGFYFYGMRNDNIEGLASVQLISENLVVIMKNFGDNPSDLICTTDSRTCTTDSLICTTDSRICTTDSRICTTDSRICTTDSRICTTDSRICTTDSRICTTDSRICTSDSRICTTDSLTCTRYILTCNFGGDYGNINMLIYNHSAFIK